MINPFNRDISQMKTMSDSLNAELEKTILEGEAGAGMVKAKATGTGKIVSVEVTDEVYAMGDRNDMCVLIVSAVNAALEKSNQYRAEKGMSALKDMGLRI